MTLQELRNVLVAIDGFSTKVVYYAWPEDEAPALPFICYYEKSSSNFIADGKVYHKQSFVAIELYSKLKDVTSEGLVETALTSAGLVWSKTEDYIETERCYMITYEIEV